MDQAFKIIQMLHNQTPIDEIEKGISWENLSQADFENLFAEVELLGSAKSGFDLLGLMYKAAKDRDYWIETRILAAVIIRPESDIERNKLLKRMGYCLDLIRKSLARIPKADPQQLRYRRYLCDYVYLSARLLEDAGDIDQALKEYTAAQKAYTQYNFMAAAKEIDAPIARLQRLKRQGDQLIDFHTLVDHRDQLEKEISNLSLQYQRLHNQLEETDAQIKLKETELLSLKEQSQELKGSIETNQIETQKLKEETLELENRKETSQAWLDQIEQEKSALVEHVINLREQAQALDIRVAQTALKLNDRLAALQAQIDLKVSELEKTEGMIRQKTINSNELEESIGLRRQELAALEETIHKEEGYLIELSKRVVQIETEPDREPASSEKPVLDEQEDESQAELATKLERYKKSLKAKRTRKTTKPSQDSNQG